MKKILTCLSILTISNLFSQITLSSAMPSNINPGESFDVEVKITKGTVSNFAKYQLDVPAGYGVTAIDAKNGNFTFENKRAKIVWVSIPAEPDFTIKLKVQANSDAVNSGTFSQKFYYLENNEKKEVEGTPVTITIGGAASTVGEEKKPDAPITKEEPIAVATPNKVPEPVAEKKIEKEVVAAPVKKVEPTPVAEKKVTPVESKPVKKADPAMTTESNSDLSSKKSAPTTSSNGLTYKIQLSSSTTPPNKGLYAKAGTVDVEQIDGAYKVVTGNYSVKEEAINRLIELKGKGLNGFVVKYENGKRVK